MEKSESIKEISKALCNFQSEVEKIDLNKTVIVQTKNGGTYNFKYATFSNGIESIKPAMKKNGLSFSQIIESDSSVTTLLMHESGEYLSGNLLLKTNEQNAQAIGSMITYAKRYSLFSILGIVADDDDDGNAATGNHISQTSEKEQDNRPWLNANTKEWTAAIKFLNEGGLIPKIEEKYRISKTNKEKLIKESL